MSVSDERRRILLGAYDAFNRRDIEAVLVLLDPEVDWPNVLEQKIAHGHAAVREYWQRQFAQIDPRVEPVDFVAQGDCVAVLVEQIVRDRQGRVQSESRVVHVYAFRGDRIAAMRVLPSLEEARR